MSDYKLENGILQTPSGSCTLTSEFILPQLIGEMVDEITSLQAQLDEAEDRGFNKGVMCQEGELVVRGKREIAGLQAQLDEAHKLINDLYFGEATILRDTAPQEGE